MTQPSTPSEDHGPVLSATPARQGRYGKPVFWVLLASTFLAALGLFLAWTWKAPSLARDDVKKDAAQAQGAPAFSAPDPGPATQQRSPTPQQ